MKYFYCIAVYFLFFTSSARAQKFFELTPQAKHWVDSTYKKLKKDERIGQLIVIRAHSNLGNEHVQKVTDLIKRYNVGGLCFFQGGPFRQAILTNQYQELAKTPLLVCIDGEWGLGMRLDSVINYPRQLLLGSIQDADLIYKMGKAIGNQCKRLGIHVNYAPDVDVNNNPNNPVINDRSFGEDKFKVARFGIAYMQGMQDVGVMACAKHFPGHGDVAVDSHLDLPVINKSKSALDSLELFPFKSLIQAGVGSVMTAHLSIPAIDTTANQPTSLSYKTVTQLLQQELGYNGLIFTDGLEMKGVTKYYPNGEASVQSLIAGNDMLCVPEDVPLAIEKIRKAIKEDRLSWKDIEKKVKKVLLAKFHLGLTGKQWIDTTNLLNDLNKETSNLKQKIAQRAVTLLASQKNDLTPITNTKKIAYVCIGAAKEPWIVSNLKANFQADVYFFGSKAEVGKQLMDDKSSTSLPVEVSDTASAIKLIAELKNKKYDIVLVGMHNYSRRPANNFGIGAASIFLIQNLTLSTNSILLNFGNPYAIKNYCNALNLAVFYEDDETTNIAAYDWLTGKIEAKGLLPVTVCPNLTYGSGITDNRYLNKIAPEVVGFNASKLAELDKIATDGLNSGAYPGCVVLVAKNGKLVYEKAFGFISNANLQKTTTHQLYDLASITKTAATTVAIMQLVEKKRISLDATIGSYLPWLSNSNKANLTIKQLLLHESGMVPFIPFYKEIIDTTTGIPNPAYLSSKTYPPFTIPVAQNLFLNQSWSDTILQRIKQSALTPTGQYIYSDNNFIILGKIVEQVTGVSLNEYVAQNIYEPLQMTSTTYLPLNKFSNEQIVPTENEKHFRQQLIHGYVHDEGSALMGGVAGHAGLFSNAYDLLQLYQLLLNKGSLNNQQLFAPETVEKFTEYGSNNSRRGLGFDKPEKNNNSRKDPYPCKSASPKTFGHTGFTGTCVWADPEKQLVFIFLSNRVNPTRDNNLLSQLAIRPRLLEAVYQALSNNH